MSFSSHHPMRLRQLLPVLFGALVVSSACSIDATAPSGLAAPQRVAASRGGVESGSRQGWNQDDVALAGRGTYVVTIDPTHQHRLHFGKHTLIIPANALCSAESSGYGLDVFDTGCTAETRTVAITATVSTDARGLPRIVLGPEVRFSPDKEVVLSMWVGSDLIATTTSWRILYCSDGDFENCVDESILDPSLAAHVDLKHGTVWRRIKHFSGYFLDT